MALNKIKVVIVEKTGNLKETSIILTKKFNISKTSFIYYFDSFKIAIYGKTGTNGTAGQENKYEFPPPFDKELFFEDCVLVKYSLFESNPLMLTINEWKELYNNLYGGFEILKDTEDNDEEEYNEIEEEDRLLNNPNVKFTKEGYIKDEMFVDDSEDENDQYDDLTEKKTKRSKKTNKEIIGENVEPVEEKKIKKSKKTKKEITGKNMEPVEEKNTKKAKKTNNEPIGENTEPVEEKKTKKETIEDSVEINKEKKTKKAKKTNKEPIGENVEELEKTKNQQQDLNICHTPPSLVESANSVNFNNNQIKKTKTKRTKLTTVNLMTEESSENAKPDILETLETSENVKDLKSNETSSKKVDKKTKSRQLKNNDQPDDVNKSSETTVKKSKKQKKDINDPALKNTKQKTKTLSSDTNNITTHSYPLTCDNELIVEDYET